MCMSTTLVLVAVFTWVCPSLFPRKLKGGEPSGDRELCREERRRWVSKSTNKLHTWSLMDYPFLCPQDMMWCPRKSASHLICWCHATSFLRSDFLYILLWSKCLGMSTSGLLNLFRRQFSDGIRTCSTDSLADNRLTPGQQWRSNSDTGLKCSSSDHK